MLLPKFDPQSGPQVSSCQGFLRGNRLLKHRSGGVAQMVRATDS
jgi:hypothetical protein